MLVFSKAIILSAQDFDSVEIKTIKITENIYMLQGRGGNIGVIVGKDGVLMIDDEFAPLGDKIRAAISKISDKQIKFLINTHWHRDHTGGNEIFANSGAIIVAHENVRKTMSTQQFIKMFKRTVPPSPKAALPIVTFSKDINFYINEEEIKVLHIQNAHTDGDGVIYFKNSNVLHMGDIYFAERYPFIDLSSGGSITGVIRGVEFVLSFIDENTKIIPGHGNLSNKEELSEYLDMLKSAKLETEDLIKKGKSFQEIVDSDVLKEFDPRYGQGFLKRDKFLSIVYDSLSNK
ncbi:MAG: MBL fold metallo-hydrolase [Candidatus Dadabacteria bacterium]|nr:MBL fold metallo-hydrolase [Candidatus Dadabacteria bacterium]